ncbi:hypothetical protein ES703_71715 [subsurface metagenome]
MMVTVKVTFSPGTPLLSGGDTETSMPLTTTALAMQVALSLTVGSAREVAVTVISSSSPEGASSGIVTVSVAGSSLFGRIVSEARETARYQSALSIASRSYVSSTFPVFLTVTIKVSVSPGTPLLSGGDIETSTPLTAVVVAMQVALSLTSSFSTDVAVTVISVDSFSIASLGTVTLTVVVRFSPNGIESELLPSVAPQPALSLTVKS